MKAKILALLAIIGGALAAIFKVQAEKAKAESAEQRADIAETGRQVLEDVNDGLSDLEEKHHAEELDDNAAVARGDRGGFDNDGLQ